MCQTIQWVFNCTHPATYRFRNAVCQFPGSTACQLEDYSETLPVSCRKCTKRVRNQSTMQPSQLDPAAQILIPNETWFVPSRCFIDVGFSTLDPFALDRKIQMLNSDHAESISDSNSDSGSDSRSNSTSDPGSFEASAVCGQYGCHDMPGSSLFQKARKTSPCCIREQKVGAYQTTRLEGFEHRYEGRIVDSHCESAT